MDGVERYILIILNLLNMSPSSLTQIGVKILASVGSLMLACSVITAGRLLDYRRCLSQAAYLYI
jgi:hypothetical protein